MRKIDRFKTQGKQKIKPRRGVSLLLMMSKKVASFPMAGILRYACYDIIILDISVQADQKLCPSGMHFAEQEIWYEKACKLLLSISLKYRALWEHYRH